jgi:hypothetical protein
MFSKYAAVVKNLRGVLLLELGEENIEASLNWLVKRFKYRNVGVPPSLVAQGWNLFQKHLEKGPFLELVYPVKSLTSLADLVETGLGIGKNTAEALVLASAYVSPLLVLGEKSSRILGSLSVDRVDVRVRLTPRDLKLHLRIADYSVLDLYRWSVESAERLWTKKNLSGLAKERAERIARDKKRYWRLRGSGKPLPFLFYVDLVQKIAKNTGLLKNLLKLPPQEASAGLAILTAVVMGGERETLG